MKTAFVLLVLFSFLIKFSALGLPRVDYNQFAKSLDKKLPHDINEYDVTGCCPTIVKGSSEISASGCEVQVNVVINVIPGSGKESTQVMQNCTAEDHKFIWTVDWGDGTKDIGHQWSIGGYGINHALPCTTPTTYGVTANYCSDPDDTVEHRCCDSIFRLVRVPA